jgi:hypothetical protein
MTYIVSAFIKSRWRTVLVTSDKDHATAFKREIRGIKTKIETVKEKVKS